MAQLNRHQFIYRSAHPGFSRLKGKLLLALSIIVLSYASANAVFAKGKRFDTPEAFTSHVLSIANEDFPELEASAAKSPLSLKMKDGGQLSLENLFKGVKSSFSPSEADAEIRRYLKTIAALDPKIEKTPSTWDEVMSRLRPQIFPADYTKSNGGNVKIVHRPLPFSKTLFEGFVIDAENTFQYVTTDHLSKWKVNQAQVASAAYKNLDKQCESLKIDFAAASGKGARGKYLTIAITDGYAAARLLLPQVRSRIERELGHPCFVAIPNRDYLIAWSHDYSDSEKARNQVKRDFHYRDHPLSPRIYRLNNMEISAPTEPVQKSTADEAEPESQED